MFRFTLKRHELKQFICFLLIDYVYFCCRPFPLRWGGRCSNLPPPPPLRGPDIFHDKMFLDTWVSGLIGKLTEWQPYSLANCRNGTRKNFLSAFGGNYCQNACSVHAASWYGANACERYMNRNCVEYTNKRQYRFKLSSYYSLFIITCCIRNNKRSIYTPAGVIQR